MVGSLSNDIPLKQCGGKLQPRMEGAVCEVFARTLRGLSGAKLTKPGAFRTSDGEAYSLRCSYKVGRWTIDVACACWYYMTMVMMMVVMTMTTLSMTTMTTTTTMVPTTH